MNKIAIILSGIALIFIIIVPYIIKFHNCSAIVGITSWGTASDYINIVISILSIYLIYVTYKEQRYSNKISRFEDRYKTFVHTFIDFVDKEKTLLHNGYDALCKHFVGVITDEPVGTVEENSKIMVYYYSDILLSTKTESLNECFKYLNFFIGNLHQSKDISTEEKQARLLELSSVIPESVRILFFCWKLCENDRSLLDYCYMCHFLDIFPNDGILANIIRYICNGDFIKNNSHKIDGKTL